MNTRICTARYILLSIFTNYLLIYLNTHWFPVNSCNLKLFYIYIFCLGVCLFVCLYPINVKTAEMNRPKKIWGLAWPKERFLDDQNSRKKLSFCHKLRFSNSYNLATRFPRPLKFQTINSGRLNSRSLKYQRFTTTGSKNIGVRKYKIVAKNSFAFFKIHGKK